MQKNFWDPSAGLYGLFNVCPFKGLAALVSSGLGGGCNALAGLPRAQRFCVTPTAESITEVEIPELGGIHVTF
jgi:hypothetical protein